MAVMDVMTSVSKETYEMGEAFVALVQAIKIAVEDGWQTGKDLPIVVSAVLANMSEILDGLKSAKGEWEEDEAAMVQAVTMTVAKLVAELRRS